MDLQYASSGKTMIPAVCPVNAEIQTARLHVCEVKLVCRNLMQSQHTAA